MAHPQLAAPTEEAGPVSSPGFPPLLGWSSTALLGSPAPPLLTAAAGFGVSYECCPRIHGGVPESEGAGGVAKGRDLRLDDVMRWILHRYHQQSRWAPLPYNAEIAYATSSTVCVEPQALYQ
eukprot:1159122-Pelagomonas_calceolata.AAC.14